MEKSILILAGPSAVGKTTVMDELVRLEPRFEYIRSATTRAPRGDVHDSEYIYLTREEFLSRIDRAEMLEYVEYGSNLYGTPASEIERIFAEGKIPLLILELNGIRSIKSKRRDYSTFAVYIYDDINVIEKRLYDRGLSKDPTAENLLAFMKRKNANIADYSSLPEMVDILDGTVRNSTVTECAKTVLELYRQLSIGKANDREAVKATCIMLAESVIEKK